MIRPAYLKKGDSVAIVAPARRISQNEVEAAKILLQNLGLNVVYGTNLFHSCHQFSGTDQERTLDFQQAIDDPKIKAVFCARGGYGSVRIIDQLDFSLFTKNPKWIVGYSDVTVFHSHIHQNFGIETLHAEMPLNFEKHKTQPSSLNTIQESLFGRPLNYSIKKNDMNRNGRAQGILCGGNLSMLYSLLGSPSDIETAGKILFIEDLDEYLYHIDRMLMNLKRNGKLQNLAALIVGGMNKMNDNTIPFGKTAQEIIAEHISEYSYPVCFGFPAGHQPDNRALILGRNTTLEITENKVSLIFE
jgi:muramoyltetrapeptide carboxypeptidase